MDVTSTAPTTEKTDTSRVTAPMPLEDPVAGLHPTALRILDATERTVIEDGLAKVTMEAVAARAELNRGLIHYHYRTKDALLTTLVDWLMYRTCLAIVDGVRDAGPEVRARLFARALRNSVECTELYLLNYELLPHILRTPDLRARVARVYVWYWQINLGWLGATDEGAAARVHGLAVMVAALCDGLALQLALEPAGLDLDAVFDSLEAVLTTAMSQSAPAS